MDIDSPDDYEPPPDRIPDRAPERAPVDTPAARRCDRATASRSKTGTGSTTTRSSAPPTPGIRQSSASETAGRSTNSAGPPTPGTTPADHPAPRLLARRNHPVGTGIRHRQRPRLLTSARDPTRTRHASRLPPPQRTAARRPPGRRARRRAAGTDRNASASPPGYGSPVPGTGAGDPGIRAHSCGQPRQPPIAEPGQRTQINLFSALLMAPRQT